MSSPPISISHWLFRCRYSNSRDVVASSPSFSRADASAPENLIARRLGRRFLLLFMLGETERMRLFHGNIQILFQLMPWNKKGTKTETKQQGKLHRQRKRAPPTFGNKGYTISVNFKRAYPPPGPACSSTDGGEFVRKPLPGGGAFVNSSRSG